MRTTAARADSVWGSNDLTRLFPVDEDGPALSTTTPWPQASRRKDVQDYEKDKIRDVMLHPDHYHVEDVDPRRLHSTQPALLRGGVQHYLDDSYARTGRTFADMGNAGNRRPLIYVRDDGQEIILSGHHRAAAALLKGVPLRAVVIRGHWGVPRKIYTR